MEKVEFNSRTMRPRPVVVHEPVRNAKETAAMCCFKNVNVLHAKVGRGEFPAPVFQSTGASGVRRNFWTLSSINKFLKENPK